MLLAVVAGEGIEVVGVAMVVPELSPTAQEAATRAITAAIAGRRGPAISCDPLLTVDADNPILLMVH